MDPKELTSEEVFRILLLDYMKKKGLHKTAKIFQNEGQVSGELPEYDGFLHDWWVMFYDIYNSRDPKLQSSSEDEEITDSTQDWSPQIPWERYCLCLLAGYSSKDRLSSCDFSSNGKIVASGGRDKKVFICYMDTDDTATTSEAHSELILDLRFQQGSTKFATCSTDKTVNIWDATKPGTLSARILTRNGPVRSLDFHPIDREILCIATSFDVIELWNIKQWRRIRDIMAGGRIVRFQPRFGRFLAIAKGNVITIVDVKVWGVLCRLQGHIKDIFSFSWDKTGQMIASVSEDSARVWSVVVAGSCIHELPSNGKRFHSIIFHPRYDNAVVIGGDECLYLWNPECGEIDTITAHKGSITGLAASTQKEYIASASNDQYLRIWK